MFQDPDEQIFAASVARELTLGRRDLTRRRGPGRNSAWRVSGTWIPRLLSAGQKQRLVLAVALASEPRVLLCDEPTALQDPGQRRGCWTVWTLATETGRGPGHRHLRPRGGGPGRLAGGAGGGQDRPAGARRRTAGSPRGRGTAGQRRGDPAPPGPVPDDPGADPAAGIAGAGIAVSGVQAQGFRRRGSQGEAGQTDRA